MANIRYLLDENMPHAVRDQLLWRIPALDITVVGAENGPSLGTLDPDILRWIEEKGYILVSRNRRTMPDHLHEHLAEGHHIPGIFLVRRQSSLGQIIEDLALIWGASDPDEYQDRIIYLPL